jgi:hypothetical protein
MANTFYNRSIRKIIVGFGDIFNNITLVRYNLDNTEQERFIVPIAYASKERYVMRLEEDPDLTKKVQMAIPKMAYELNGISYDASRKLNTNIRNFTQGSNASVIISQYNPVPYDFDFSLYLMVRNIEDGTQIIEHILPYFTPDYTIKLNLIPEMSIVKEIPVILKSTTYEVDFEGGREHETRRIIWTLNFTVKGYIFGAMSNVGLIKTSITNVFNDIALTDSVRFNMANNGTGSYKTGEFVYQGYSVSTATATAKVSDWTSNSQLLLTNIEGNFVSNHPIIGLNSNASHSFTSYNVNPLQYAKIVVKPNPTTANANSNYTYTTQISEYPNIT